MATEISATETPTETHHHTHKVKIKTPSMGDMGMDPTLSALLASNRNGTDGLFGAGSGGGLLGGILLASLLRGNGGLFGGDNAGAGAATIGQIQQTLETSRLLFRSRPARPRPKPGPLLVVSVIRSMTLLLLSRVKVSIACWRTRKGSATSALSPCRVSGPLGMP